MKQVSWQTIAMVAVIGGIAVALASFTRWSSSDITTLVAVISGLAVGGVVGGGVAGAVGDRVDEVHALNLEQTKTLHTVERRTNGELDARIAAAQQEAAEQGAALALAELRKGGVLP